MTFLPLHSYENDKIFSDVLTTSYLFSIHLYNLRRSNILIDITLRFDGYLIVLEKLITVKFQLWREILKSSQETSKTLRSRDLISFFKALFTYQFFAGNFEIRTLLK